MKVNGNLRGKRKFTVAVMALCMGFVLTLLGRMVGAEFVTLAGLVMGLYGFAAATTAAVSNKKNGE